MSFTPLIDVLAIPPGALVDQRVPKKLLLEQGPRIAADKRCIQDGIEEMTWVAALKPTNIGVPAFKDAEREYLEIAVLAVVLRPKAKLRRLIELIHRTIPYPLVLITEHSETISLSLAHKRWSLSEGEKVVIEEVRQVSLRLDASSAEDAAFLASLAISRLPTRDLFALYAGVLDSMTALGAARITGRFAPPESAERASAMRDGLDLRARLERDLAVLRARALQEKQLNRRVELNLEIKRLEAELAANERSL